MHECPTEGPSLDSESKLRTLRMASRLGESSYGRFAWCLDSESQVTDVSHGASPRRVKLRVFASPRYNRYILSRYVKRGKLDQQTGSIWMN